jgi:P-type E1-E2 ATPase
VLAQQLNAIESLASVDTICVDKTGTLTEAALRVRKPCQPLRLVGMVWNARWGLPARLCGT